MTPGELRNGDQDLTSAEARPMSQDIPESALHFLHEVQGRFAAAFIRRVGENSRVSSLDYPDVAGAAMVEALGAEQLESPVTIPERIEQQPVSWIQTLREFITNPIP